MEREIKGKVKELAIIAVITVSYIMAVKYVLPLIWPVVAGFVLAKLISPIVSVLKKYLKCAGGLASAIVLTIVIGVICAIIVLAGVWIYKWIGEIIRNRDDYGQKIYVYLCDICGQIENTLDIERGVLTENVVVLCNQKINEFATTFFVEYMGSGIGMVKVAAEVLITCVIIYVCGVLMAKDMEGIKEKVKGSRFGKEFFTIYGKTKKIFGAYIKAQFIIMCITALVCIAALYIIRLDNAIVTGLLIGLLDALPMIGIGIILVPWSIINIFSGKYLSAVVLFVTFIICSILREIVEPKLVADKVGIHPVITLAALFAGYKLFGIIGFILGPAGFVIVREVYNLAVGKTK